MGFGGNRRGQSVQIGAVLLFGVLVLSLTTYQATVVPQENGEVEFNHNQRVQNDLLQLRNGVLGTATSGSARPVTVELGTRYPARAFLVNPGPASGSLRTVDLGGTSEIGVSNAAAVDGETADFWDGSGKTYSTHGIDYTPNYNEFDSAPTTAYENTVVYNRAPVETGGGVVSRSEQTVVDGRTLNLVALQGELDTAAVESLSVSLDGDSAPARTVAVTDSGSALTVEIPTELPESTWQELLDGQLDRDTSAGDASDGDDQYVAALSCTNPDPCGTLTLTFETGVTYDLRLAGVSVGSGSVSTAPTYAVDLQGDDTSIPEGGSQKLVVQIRDRYNNPVSGVLVSLTTSPSDGSVTALSPTTDDDGEAVFRYDAPPDVNTATSVQIGLGFDGPGGDSTPGSTPSEEALFDVTVMNADGSAATGSSPRVDNLATSSPNSGELTVDWTVSDPNNDINEVEVVVRDSGGSIVRSDSFAAGGGSDSDSVTYTGLAADTYDVTLTVRDNDGNADSQTSSQSVSTGGGGSASDIQVTNSATSGPQNSVVEFTLENTGRSDAIITGVSVDSTTNSAERVSDGGNPEFLQDGAARLDQDIQVGGGQYTLDSNALVVAGSTSTFELNKFKTNTGGPVDMSGSTVTTTLYFQDGSSKTITLTL